VAAINNNRFPHLKDFRYSFAGAAFPRDSGLGGVRGWNRVCIDRRGPHLLRESWSEGSLLRELWMDLCERDFEIERLGAKLDNGLHLTDRRQSAAARRNIILKIHTVWSIVK